MTTEESLPELLPKQGVGLLAKLSPLFIPGQIPNIHDPDGKPNSERVGVNVSMITSNANGLLVNVLAYFGAQAGDNIQIFSSLDPTALLSFNLLLGQENETSHVFIPAHLLEAGFQTMWFVVIRNSQNIGKSDLLSVFISFLFPGSHDPYPDRPGHYGLLPAVFLNVPPGGITRELAESAEGVRFRIRAYRNMRQFDVITCSFGGVEFHITVQFDQVGTDIEAKIPLHVIVDARNGNHILIYRPLSEVHNRASDWSLRRTVYSEGEGGLLRPVLLDEVEVDAVTGELFYDLEKVKDKDIRIDVVTRPLTFELKDLVKLSVATMKDGVISEVYSEEKPVEQLNSSVKFFLPNAAFLQLAREHLYVRYELKKVSTGESLRSSRTTVWLKGTAVNLPPLDILPRNGVVVDPAKAATAIVAPHALIRAQSWLHAFFIGTAPGGTVYSYDSGRRISSTQAIRPMTFPLLATFLKSLDGGSLDAHYTVGSVQGDPLAVRSLSFNVRVGERQPDLGPIHVPDAENGVLDPEKLPLFSDAELRVLPFVNMQGMTVFLSYQSDNPLDSQPYHDSIDIADSDVGLPVFFYLYRDWLLEQIGFKVTITYTVEPTDGSGPERFGTPVTVSIGAGASKLLPKPEALEADENGIVKPIDTIANGLSLVIKGANLKNGDYVIVDFDGDAPNGDYRHERPISFSGEGKDFALQVPYQYVHANQNLGVRVSYKVERVDGRVEPSDVLLLRVQPAVLPVIAIAEARGANLDQINPDDVPADGANAIIGASARLKAGDTVIVELSGASPIPKLVLISDEGRDVIVKIPRNYIEQHNGNSFTARYVIRRKAGGPDEPSEYKNFNVRRVIGSGKFKVMGARHNSNTYRSSSVSCRLVALSQLTLLPMLVEWRYEGDVIWTAGTEFIDKEPSRDLHVRSSTDGVALNKVNVCGNGVDGNTAGAAAMVVLRNPRVSAGGVIGGSDLSGAGNGSYGGAVPPTYLIQENLKAVHCTGGAFAALTKNNDVVAWGEATSGGSMGAVNPSGIEALASNSYAFAALTSNNDVRCWGHASYGGASPGLSNIKRVFNGGLAFAAERMDGSLVGWGHAAAGGVANPAPGITNVEKLIGSYQAFAGITQTKRLFAFGLAGYGGAVPANVASLTDIARLCCANARAFAALTLNGNVVTWGDATYGGHLPNYPGIATLQFVDVVSTWWAFAGITKNNRVAAWGQAPAGVVPSHIAALTNAVAIAGTSHAFAVLCADGTVRAWGNAALGGDTSAVAGQLFNVVAIYTCSHGFMALTSDGRVVTWGHATALAGAAAFNGFVSHLNSLAAVPVGP